MVLQLIKETPRKNIQQQGNTEATSHDISNISSTCQRVYLITV